MSVNNRKRVRGRDQPTSTGRGLLLFVVLVPLLVYGQSVQYDYVQADDADLILKNRLFISQLGNIPDTFTRSYFEVDGELNDQKTYYRPLVISSLILDTQLGSGEATVYHVTNVAMHTLVVFLLYSLLIAMQADRRVAGACALLFAVHPVNVQAVCWIVGRNDLLLAVWVLISMLSLIRFSRTHATTALLGHLIAFALALFTKESAIMMLPLFVLFAWLWVGQSSFYLRHRSVLMGYGVILLGWYGLRQQALSGGDVFEVTTIRSLSQTLFVNIPDLLVHTGKVVAPIRLSIMPSLDVTGLMLGVLALGVCVTILGRVLTPRRQVFVGGWFLLFLLPTLLVDEMPIYEHRAYVPLLGLCIGLSQIKIAEHTARRQHVVAVILLALFTVQTVRHSAVFTDRFTYWASATNDSPYAPIALVNLGQMEEERGRPGQAELHYRRALSLDPETPKANNNLGIVLMAKGDSVSAKARFLEELRVNPENAEAHFNLGLYNKLVGRIADAVPYWKSTLELNPYFVPAYQNLADYYHGIDDVATARYYESRLEALNAP